MSIADVYSAGKWLFFGRTHLCSSCQGLFLNLLPA